MPGHDGESTGERLDVRTYRGRSSTPWQYSVVRTDAAIVVEQARGPPSEFDPVEKRFELETRPLGADPVEFRHAVSRRSWVDDDGRSSVRSQRSEGRLVDVLYRDADGWHVDRPEPASTDGLVDTGGEFELTDLPGVTVAGTFVRTAVDGETKVTAERTYRFDRRVFHACEAVYVLTRHEVDEESFRRDLWAVENAVATRLAEPPALP